jgi:hypothetical protein
MQDIDKGFMKILKTRNTKARIINLLRIFNFLIKYFLTKDFRLYFIKAEGFDLFLRTYLNTYLFKLRDYVEKEEILDVLMCCPQKYVFISEVILSLEKEPDSVSNFNTNFHIFLNVRLKEAQEKAVLENDKFFFPKNTKASTKLMNKSMSLLDSFLDDSIIKIESKEQLKVKENQLNSVENNEEHSLLLEIVFRYFEINLEGKQ